MREDIYAFHMEAGAPFAVEMCGTSFCDGSYHIYREHSKIYVMEFVLEGRGRVAESGKSAIAEAGDVYFLRKGRRHDYQSDPASPWTKIWFNFTGEAVDRLCECYGLDSGIVFHAPEVRPLFEEAIAIGKSSRDYVAVSEGIAVVFLKILQELSHLEKRGSESAKIAGRLRKHIDETDDFSENLDAIMKRLGCTKSHAIREFRAVYGTTPYEYMQKRRFGLAKAMLRNTAMSISSIAERLGFYDVHYFSGSFKRRIGKSPNQYRKA